ncbi:uncharacterized protein SOCE836_035460 [Sorangium cellulosum]|uniref:Uncharacterized protein n=1 Tax=Sorangium cellulosum TaxID=56 RepID=A0A4P2QMU7_SORCE|nr:uncharacterized protein SOCE836_035460 [Sorangium cellulosum]WCQ90799.1 hypothetical protein NQZ70_03511 [Sorangium sp. Soce836]
MRCSPVPRASVRQGEASEGDPLSITLPASGSRASAITPTSPQMSGRGLCSPGRLLSAGDFNGTGAQVEISSDGRGYFHSV